MGRGVGNWSELDDCSILAPVNRKFRGVSALQRVRAYTGMGNVISLADRRRESGPVAPARGNRFVRATFSFDLALPETYLAAERVDHMIAGVRWQAASAQVVHGGPLQLDALMASAEERAAVLRVPLVWPDRFGHGVGLAMRAATLACEMGRGAAFVLAASRLAFCGGFDLGDPEVLAEAAAAASIPLDRLLAAARDDSRDAWIEDAGHRLAASGADRLPALRVRRTLFCGEARLGEAIAAVRAGLPALAHEPATA